MEKLKLNPNNAKYYSEDFIKGFECGVERQFEKDKVELTPIVRGKWIDGGYNVYICSICNESLEIVGEKYAYCPFCGAKMEESGEGIQ